LFLNSIIVRDLLPELTVRHGSSPAKRLAGGICREWRGLSPASLFLQARFTLLPQVSPRFCLAVRRHGGQHVAGARETGLMNGKGGPPICSDIALDKRSRRGQNTWGAFGRRVEGGGVRQPVSDAGGTCASIMLSDQEFEQIRGLFLRGLYLQAYALAQRHGPLAGWTVPRERRLAAWLVGALGDERLESAIRIRAYRANRRDPVARVWFGWELLDRRGALLAWEYLRANSDLQPPDTDSAVDWLGLQARVARMFRDFDLAERRLEEAQAVGGNTRWLAVERVCLLVAEDRVSEALAAAERILEAHPDYVSAVWALAYAYGLQDRYEDAVSLLSAAAPRYESGGIWMDLACRQLELERLDAASESLDRYEQVSPLLGKTERRRLNGLRSDLASRRGDRAAAIRFADAAGQPFFRKISENLRAAPNEARRVMLNVPFVRQHHMTCGPATLSAVARFWNHPVDHLEVVDSICYDGTSNHAERRWVEQNGFVAREFTVTWESAVALLDHGLPFTLVTTWPGRAHLQAVIGYDAARGTLLVRDPSSSYRCEYVGRSWLAEQASSGPRGMALVPRAQAALLDGLALPDAGLYDLRNEASLALEAHDRVRAEAAWQAMSEQAPNHYLTHLVRWAMACYDGDNAAALASADQLLALFPNDSVLLARKVGHLTDRACRQQRLAIVEERCAQSDPDPFFLVEYGDLLNEDGRERGRAVKVLRHSSRRWATNDGLLSALGSVFWNQRRFDLAMEHYRLASCLSETSESHAQAFFQASRYLLRTEEALAFLQARFDRFGAKSSLPAETLHWALEELDRVEQGMDVLHRAMARRPDDGRLTIRAAEALARRGQYDRAEQLLVKARDRCRPVDWLRAAALLAGYRNDRNRALDGWRQILKVDPGHAGAHREVARLLAESEGSRAAIAHLHQAVDRHPHNYRLHQLLIEWLRDEEMSSHEAAARRLTEVSPVDAWARREWAESLQRQQRFDEALVESELACRLDDSATWGYSIRASIELDAGRTEAARESFRAAIHRSVDNEYAISGLLRMCRNMAERREALDFVRGQLVEQVIFGDGLLQFRTQARETLSDDELLAVLREAQAARPDLWHAWSALSLQLTDMGQVDEAEATARQAVARFPLLPRVWTDLATVYRAKADAMKEEEALRKALELNHNWSYAARTLTEVLDKQGRRDEARQILERAVANDPLDAVNHGYLADLLWKMGDKAAALDSVERAVKTAPGYSWAWDVMHDWASELKCVERCEAAARELVHLRPNECRSWRVLFRVLRGAEHFEERLAAVERALELSPRNEEVHDWKAWLLAENQRIDEALAACRPPPWGEQPPVILQMRAARICASHGQADRAIELYRQIVTDDPVNAEAWQGLADAYDTAGRKPEYLDAAEHLQRLRPKDAIPMGYLGHALQVNDRPADAKTWFRRALAVDPGYEYAGFHLFDLCFDDREMDEAGQTLAALKSRTASPYITSREVQMAVWSNDFEAAEAGLRELSVRPDDDDWPLQNAVEAAAGQMSTDRLDRILRDALKQPAFHPSVGHLWLKHVGPHRMLFTRVRFVERLIGLGSARASSWAVADLVVLLGEHKHRVWLRYFVARQRQWLRDDTWSWAHTGRALRLVRRYRAVVRWYDGYAERKDLHPWMMHILMASLRQLGRPDEASEASRFALSLSPDHATNSHRVMLAYGEASHGRFEEARQLIEPVKAQIKDLDEEARCVLSMVRAMLAVGLDQDKERYRRARGHLNEVKCTCFRWHCFMRRGKWATEWRIVRTCGFFRGILWLLGEWP
jgi:tetratricopeptide (TPR) repeat protein